GHNPVLKPGVARLNGFLEIIRPLNLYLSAKNFVVACDVQHVKVSSSKTEVGHLAFRRRDGDYRIYPSELIHHLETTEAGNVDPPVAVALQAITPCIFIRVADMQPP